MRRRRVRTPKAARFLYVAPATLEKWRYSRPDGPPFEKRGTQIFYDLDELEKWVTQHTVRAGDDHRPNRPTRLESGGAQERQKPTPHPPLRQPRSTGVRR